MTSRKIDRYRRLTFERCEEILEGKTSFKLDTTTTLCIDKKDDTYIVKSNAGNGVTTELLRFKKHYVVVVANGTELKQRRQMKLVPFSFCYKEYGYNLAYITKETDIVFFKTRIAVNYDGTINHMGKDVVVINKTQAHCMNYICSEYGRSAILYYKEQVAAGTFNPVRCPICEEAIFQNFIRVKHTDTHHHFLYDHVIKNEYPAVIYYPLKGLNTSDMREVDFRGFTYPVRRDFLPFKDIIAKTIERSTTKWHSLLKSSDDVEERMRQLEGLLSSKEEVPLVEIRTNLDQEKLEEMIAASIFYNIGIYAGLA